MSSASPSANVPGRSRGDDIDVGPQKAANAHRLLWAGFMAIMASGVGFSIRAGILGQWAEQYGFTQTELGAITGGGLTGFGIIILLSAMIAEKIGYGTLMVSAFLMHIASAALTLAALSTTSKPVAFQFLFWGMFLFAVGNGICEAVVNPLVATLFPKDKTHYLNILHAGWPAGLVVGGLLSTVLVGAGVAWQYQISLFLIPVAGYGAMLLGQKFPQSEASREGVSYQSMLREIGMLGGAIICFFLGLFVYNDLLAKFDPTQRLLGAIAVGGVLWLAFSYATGFHLGPILLAVLLITHAMVGYVELGTDSWIGKITGTIMKKASYGQMLFVYTSTLMVILRFFAGPIVEKISPLGLLCASGVLGATGLTLLGNAPASSIAFCVLAATVYALGKTFLWPTMLAVVSEQFPKGGAITIGAIGGVGMLSAGLLGGPGIGFEQDYNASADLKAKNPAVYERYKAENENKFLSFNTVGLDGAKVGMLDGYDVASGKDASGENAAKILEILKKNPELNADAIKSQQTMVDWWKTAAPTAAADKPLVTDATLYGGQMALKLTAAVPAAMAVIYLLTILYFKTKGGYTAKEVYSKHEEAERMSGGVQGPSEY
jgi:MFS family permease